MRSSFAATSLELEAARRREVLEADLGTMQAHQPLTATRRRFVPRTPGWLARLTSAGAGSVGQGRKSSAQRAHQAGVARPGS